MYAAQENPTSALAYNILGAVAGGVAEYASMLLGFPALNGLVALAYVAAVLLLARQPGASALLTARRARA